MRVPRWMAFSAAVAAIAAGLAVGNRVGSARSRSARDARELAVQAAVRSVFDAQLDELTRELDSLASAVGSGDAARARATFTAARAAFKNAECLLAAYSPPTTSALNGPPAESDGDSPPPPLGAPSEFQRIRSVLFEAHTPLTNGASRDTLRAIALTMREQTRSFRAQTGLVSAGDVALLDAMREEVARISTLGIAGFDADDPADAARESAAALDGMSSYVAAASKLAAGREAGDAWSAVGLALRAAVVQLRTDSEFRRIDRLAFITNYMEPVARAIARVRATLPSRRQSLRRAWRQQAASVFDSAAFDAAAYAPEFAPRASPALIALGKELFFEPRLSGPQTRSCASCHDPSKAFTDGRARALTLTREAQATARNTPTLINAALEPTLFADQRAGSLEDQVRRVLTSAAEMNSSPELAAARLNADSSYHEGFGRAFSGGGDTAVTALRVRIVLAAYMRTLVALNSRFDRAVRGDSAALTESERRGFNLFAGRARCGTCHFMPLFSGVSPPAFVTSEPEVIGVPNDTTRRASIDADAGREGVDHAVAHKFAFKVPTLRNVALTAPYMHNGVFTTLERVVDFYDRGGKRATNQTLSAGPLRLSDRDRKDLVAFLRTLSDTTLPRVP